MFCVCVCVGFFLRTGDNSYLSTVQILGSLGLWRVQVDRRGGAGPCAGLPEIYHHSSIPRGEQEKYTIRVGHTVSLCEALAEHISFLVFEFEIKQLHVILDLL